MSLLFSMSQKYLPTLLKKMSLPLGIAAILSGSNANALPLSNINENNYNFQQLLQLVSQSEPPEVIIDDNPRNSGYNPPPRVTSDTRFSCEIVNGEYTVMYRPESRPSQAYPWAVPSQLGGGWTPQNRCLEITRRLESYRADGLLEMTTGYENNYETICVTTQVDPTDCRIVLTVPPGQDAQLTRDLIFENLLIADDGQQTQGVYTYTSNGDDLVNQLGNVFGLGGGNSSSTSKSKSPENINLRPFLDRADGGTGEYLGKGQSIPSSPQSIPSKPQSNPSHEGKKPSIFVR